jgi:hypothetical protein
MPAMVLPVALMLCLALLAVALMLPLPVALMLCRSVLAVALGRGLLLRGSRGGDRDCERCDEIFHDHSPEMGFVSKASQAARGGGGSDPGAVPAKKGVAAAAKAARGNGSGSAKAAPQAMAEQAIAQSAERPRSPSSLRWSEPPQWSASAAA